MRSKPVVISKSTARLSPTINTLFGALATISPATGALVVTLPAAAVGGLYLFGVGFFLCSNIG